MIYHVLADLVVAVHLAYVAYVVIGLLVILIGIGFRWSWVRNPWFRFSHLAMIVVVAAEAILRFPCPLTTWENDLTRLAGGTPDEGRTFIGRLLHNTMFFDCP